MWEQRQLIETEERVGEIMKEILDLAKEWLERKDEAGEDKLECTY